MYPYKYIRWYAQLSVIVKALFLWEAFQGVQLFLCWWLLCVGCVVMGWVWISNTYEIIMRNEIMACLTFNKAHPNSLQTCSTVYGQCMVDLARWTRWAKVMVLISYYSMLLYPAASTCTTACMRPRLAAIAMVPSFSHWMTLHFNEISLAPRKG